MSEFLGFLYSLKCVENPQNQSVYEIFPIRFCKILIYVCQEEYNHSPQVCIFSILKRKRADFQAITCLFTLNKFNAKRDYSIKFYFLCLPFHRQNSHRHVIWLKNLVQTCTRQHKAIVITHILSSHVSLFFLTAALFQRKRTIFL